MRGHNKAFGSRRIFLLSVATVVTIVGPFAFHPAHAKSVQAQSPPAAFNLSDFKFEVASIKPTKTPDGGWHLNPTSDGITGVNVPLAYLVHQAYGIYENYRYQGAPTWLSSDCYDVEAKMESSVAEEFRKLPRAQRILAEHHMFQVLLEETFNLKAHRETKEFPVYFLVVAKNGSKLQESKVNPDDPAAPKNGVWGGGGTRDGVSTVTAKYVPIEQLASQLTDMVRRTVLDRTDLTGRYDLTLKYVPDYVALRSPTASASEGLSTPSASEPIGGVSIFTALQDQLGLKLESGKGPVDIIVIDHIEKPSGN
jgi:uncharacterized protein (TIGR03435 family)